MVSATLYINPITVYAVVYGTPIVQSVSEPMFTVDIPGFSGLKPVFSDVKPGPLNINLYFQA